MKKLDEKLIVFGIQGGVGSFNEEALLVFTKKENVKHYKIKHLYTTEKVLSELHKGNIDYGLFAIHNSVGGIVQESIKAMAEHKFTIVNEFAIPIRHFLMKRKETSANQITTIMAHPQVLKQCKHTLGKKYYQLTLKSGKGDLIDTAQAAKALSANKLSKDTVILGPKTLSKLYDLEIIDSNLQDDKTNNTSFLLVT